MAGENTKYINPIIGAVAEGASNIGGSIASIINTNKTIKANKAMAEYQYNKDLEMWNRQNQYNSPASQMERLKAGGLNPNLMYGQGNTGNASTLPKYQAPKVEYNYRSPEVGGAFQTYQDIQTRQAQIDNLKANTENKDQLTANAVTINTLNALKVQMEQFKKDIQGVQWMQQWRKNEADISKIGKSNLLMDFQADYLKSKTNEINRLVDARVNIANETFKNIRLRNEMNPLLRMQMEKTFDVMNADIALKKSNVGKTDLQSALLNKQKKYYDIDKIMDYWKNWKGLRIAGFNSVKSLFGK